MNVDALSRNLVGLAMDDDDFNEEIQDIGSTQADTHGAKDKIYSIQIGKDLEWLSFRRHVKRFSQHHECCFAINH
jgi:hypothetical protein